MSGFILRVKSLRSFPVCAEAQLLHRAFICHRMSAPPFQAFKGLSNLAGSACCSVPVSTRSGVSLIVGANVFDGLMSGCGSKVYRQNRGCPRSPKTSTGRQIGTLGGTASELGG